MSKREAVIVGVADLALKDGKVVEPMSVLQAQALVARDALADAGIAMREVDGLLTAGLWGNPGPGLLPTVTLSEYLGIVPRFADGTNIGGSAFARRCASCAASAASVRSRESGHRPGSWHRRDAVHRRRLHFLHPMNTMYDKPLPTIDPESAPYWAALKQHRLVLKRCRDCGRHHFYPRVLCPHCHSDALEWTDARGSGSIYSFTVARRPAGPAFKAETPYVVAVVQLDEGARMMTSIVTDDVESVRIGQRVAVQFDDVTDEVTLPKFRLA